MIRKYTDKPTDRPKVWKRTLSFILDIMVLNFIIIWPFQKIFGNYAHLNIDVESLPTDLYFAVFLVFIISLLYFSFMEYYVGQSLGQYIMGLRVSGDITLWKALLRNCYMLPFFPFYILWLAEPLYLAFYKERLLEKLTKTQTVTVLAENIYKRYNLKKV